DGSSSRNGMRDDLECQESTPRQGEAVHDPCWCEERVAQDLPRVGCVHVKRELIMRLTCQRAEQRTANSCVRDPELSEYIHLRDDLTHHTRLFNTGARHRIASSDSVLGARCDVMAYTVAIAVVDAMTDAGSTAHHLMRERRFDE